jgi:hypothetical protein
VINCFELARQAFPEVEADGSFRVLMIGLLADWFPRPMLHDDFWFATHMALNVELIEGAYGAVKWTFMGTEVPNAPWRLDKDFQENLYYLRQRA